MDEKIFKQVAKEFNLQEKKVKEIYKDWIYYIIDTICNLDCTEYNNQPVFTIPHLGKLICDEFKLKAINKNINNKNIDKNGRT